MSSRSRLVAVSLLLATAVFVGVRFVLAPKTEVIAGAMPEITFPSSPAKQDLELEDLDGPPRSITYAEAETSSPIRAEGFGPEAPPRLTREEQERHFKWLRGAAPKNELQREIEELGIVLSDMCGAEVRKRLAEGEYEILPKDESGVAGVRLDNVRPHLVEHFTNDPDVVGWERMLAYKVAILTGLRVSELGSVTIADLKLDGDHPAILLAAENTKNRVAASVPLRADLAADLRKWVEHLVEQERIAVRGSGDPMPMRLHPRTRLLRVPSIRTFDADRAFAEIDKRDDRGQVVNRHALRHTGCTWLQAADAPVQVVNAWMRHLTVASLAEKVYTDRRMINVRLWLEALPCRSTQRRRCDAVARSPGPPGPQVHFPYHFPQLLSFLGEASHLLSLRQVETRSNQHLPDCRKAMKKRPLRLLTGSASWSG